MESSHLQETLPVFHHSARTLQEMAATQCALDCWRNVIIMKNYDSDTICSDEWTRKHSSFSCADIAPFPVGVRSLINHKIRLIGKELKKWCHDHSFVRLSPGVMVNCFVLNPAGDICYKRTANNLLAANLTFSLIEQFEIACKYCFEEDVERLWFLLKNNDYNFYHLSRGFGAISLSFVGAMDYWFSKMRGELQELYKIPFESQKRSPEWFVLSNRRRRPHFANWAQIEYFWHKLNREEQSSIARDTSFDQRFMKHLVLKLDDAMLGNLSSDDLKSVFEAFAEDELCYEYALQLWSYVNVKNIIVKDRSAFYRTLVSLSKMAFRNPKSYGFHISSLLKEMWLSASIDFKSYVLSELIHFEELFERSLQYISIQSFGCDVGFFIELLRCVSFEIRQRIWKHWWRKFFLLARVSDILELITLCFNSADDIVQFKKQSMLDYDELRGIFTEFIQGGFFDELIEYLKFCCSDDEDEKLVRKARRKLVLQNFDRISRCDSEPGFCKFLQFFLDSVSSADLAELLNWEFQDKEANLLSMCILFDEGGLDIFNKALRFFRFPDQRVIELKQFFHERCLYVLTSGNFNSFFVEDWEGFLPWCTSGVEHVNRLRDLIAIDDLFENFLSIILMMFHTDCADLTVAKYRYSRKHVFNSIDSLLRWYFGGKEDPTISDSSRFSTYFEGSKFKLGKLKNYENCKAIQVLLCMEDYHILGQVLLWFFDSKKCELKNFLVDFGKEYYLSKGLWNVVKSLDLYDLTILD